jgi:hypothetical protein
VKEEDLRTFSQAIITFYGERLSEAEDTMVVPPETPVPMIVAAFSNLAKSRPAGRKGSIRVQRRWVDDQLPEYELIGALREMYRGVAHIVETAHERSGVSECSAPPFSRKCVTSTIESHLPCLSDGDPMPSMIINVETGEVSTYEYGRLVYDEEAAKIGMARYGDTFGFDKDPIVHALERLELSKRYLETDGYSGPMLVLFSGDDVRLHAVTFDEDEPRELKIATAVEANGAWQFDGALYTSEAWLAVPGGRGSLIGVRPEDLIASNDELFDADPVGNREEALSVIAFTADGRYRSLTLPFGRTKDGIVYGKLIESRVKESLPPFLRPVWRRW